MPRVLLVKTSSMGDVIHCLPAVSDMAVAVAGLTLDWVVEESLAEIAALHPAVGRVIPVASRRWRRAPLAPETWREVGVFRRAARAGGYDLVLDAQGLLRSALFARMAGAPVSGYDRGSIREPLASLFYHRRFAVSRQRHAIDRNRALAGLALGYESAGPVDYGLAVTAEGFAGLKAGAPYILALTATSRADKQWPAELWVGLGRRAAQAGLVSVLPWGSEAERAAASAIAGEIPGAVVAPRLTLGEAARLTAGARAVVGVDTGLTHLAAAVRIPVVAIYRASRPGLTGVTGQAFAVSLGAMDETPGLDAVWEALGQALAARP